MNTSQQALHDIGTETRRLARPLLIMLGVMWLVEIVDWLLFDGALDRLGIAPRQLAGLRGVPLAPLLHGGFSHLLANSLPFFILGFLVMTRHSRQFAAATVIIVLISGLGTWLLGPAYTIHIGASGLIFGYFAFLLVTAYFERSARSIFLALLVIVFYGGLLLGALPQGNHISWLGHLFGLVGGAVAARLHAQGRF